MDMRLKGLLILLLFSLAVNCISFYKNTSLQVKLVTYEKANQAQKEAIERLTNSLHSLNEIHNKQTEQFTKLKAKTMEAEMELENVANSEKNKHWSDNPIPSDIISQLRKNSSKN